MFYDALATAGWLVTGGLAFWFARQKFQQRIRTVHFHAGKITRFPPGTYELLSPIGQWPLRFRRMK